MVTPFYFSSSLANKHFACKIRRFLKSSSPFQTLQVELFLHLMYNLEYSPLTKYCFYFPVSLSSSTLSHLPNIINLSTSLTPYSFLFHLISLKFRLWKLSPPTPHFQFTLHPNYLPLSDLFTSPQNTSYYLLTTSV